MEPPIRIGHGPQRLDARAARSVWMFGLAWLVIGAVGCSLTVSLDNLASVEEPADAAVDAATDGDASSSDGSRDAVDAGTASDRPSDEDAPRDAASDRTIDAEPAVDASVDSADIDADAIPDSAAAVDGPAADTAVTASDGSLGDGEATDGGADSVAMRCPVSTPVNATLQLASVPGTTACGYAGASLPANYVGVDSDVLANSAACGTCVLIETGAGMVEALVADLGPGKTAANPTSLAVSRPALNVVVPDGSTYVTMGAQWRFTPCTLTKPYMTFTIQTGSNASYAAVLIQNHRYKIAKVEYKIGATYYPLTRSSYNYWIASQGMGTGPFTFRVSDDHDHAVEQTGVPLAPGKLFTGDVQFPACSN